MRQHRPRIVTTAYRTTPPAARYAQYLIIRARARWTADGPILTPAAIVARVTGTARDRVTAATLARLFATPAAPAWTPRPRRAA